MNLERKLCFFRNILLGWLLIWALAGCSGAKLDILTPQELQVNQPAESTVLREEQSVARQDSDDRPTEASAQSSNSIPSNFVQTKTATSIKKKLFPGTGSFVDEAALSPSPALKLPSGKITLNFIDTDIREVIRSIFSDVLKFNYVIDPRVNGTLTIRTSRPSQAGTY
ncbi:MAG: hypothetical protein HQL69_23595 [Magnetococcales bacterium]|nr:hypothetical protein [Magnetococcales bacterium]